MLFPIAIVVVSVAGTIGWMAWSLRRFRGKYRAIPRTPIGSAIAGSRVRVVGTARKLDGDVGGIFTGTPCLACHGWISGGSDAGLSDPPDRVVPFRVEDETGSILVSVSHVKLELSGTTVDVANSKAFGSSIIAREGKAAGGGGLTYWEDRLDADTRVAVIGYVVRDDKGAMVLAGRDNDPLVIANVVVAFV